MFWQPDPPLIIGGGLGTWVSPGVVTFSYQTWGRGCHPSHKSIRDNGTNAHCLQERKATATPLGRGQGYRDTMEEKT